MAKTVRRRDHFDEIGLSEREAWRARLRYVGYGDVPIEEAIDEMMSKYEPVR